MLLGRAKRVSPIKCPHCNSATRWVLEASGRNILTLILHISFFVYSLIAVVGIGYGDSNLYMTLLVIQLFLLYFLRQLYKTTLRCEAKGHVLDHRDLFSRCNFGKSKFTKK